MPYTNHIKTCVHMNHTHILTQTQPTSHAHASIRYVRLMQWGVWSPVFRPHDGGNWDTRIWSFPDPYATALRDSVLLQLR